MSMIHVFYHKCCWKTLIIRLSKSKTQNLLLKFERYLQKRYVNCTGEHRNTSSKDTEIKQVSEKQTLGKWLLRI